MDNAENGVNCTVCGNTNDSTFIVTCAQESSRNDKHAFVTNRVCKSCQVFSLKSLLMAANIIKNEN
jgi:hypothetical protein